MTSKHTYDCDGDIDESTYLKLKAVLRGTSDSISECNLEDFDGKISLSADKLEKQELMGTHDFLCVSLHFIDGSWNLKKWAVKCCSIDETYGVEPLEVIADSIKEWDIKDKIGSVTLDPEWEAEEINDIKKHVEEQKLLLNGRLFRFNCVADCIGLVVQSLFNEIRSTVFKIRKLCPTRSEPALWYVRNSNLKQALKMWSEGKFASTKGYEVPSAEEWKWVKLVCETVDKIYKVAKALFHREDVTTNLFLYHVDEILEILSGFSVRSSETFFGFELKERGISMMNDYRKDMFLVLGVATVLDPRLKMKYIEFTCSKSWGSGDASALQPETVSDAIRNLYDDYAALFPTVAQLLRAQNKLALWL